MRRMVVLIYRIACNRGGPPMNQMRANMLMQRSESEVNEMNGQQARPQSPATSGASPGIKRVRLDDGRYESVPNGRGQPQNQGPSSAQTAQNAQQLLLANGINPAQLTTQQFQTFQTQPQAMQQRSITLYAQSIAQATKQLHPGMGGPKMHPGQSGSPMMPQPSEGGLASGLQDFYQPGHGNGMRPGQMGGAGGTGGNHALQDYQMQLMLLEQQNKKRLLLARQEQGEMQPGNAEHRQAYSQGMSPNSRANPSPGPNGKPPGQMASTPKMPNQGGPGSPVPDGQIGGHIQQRSSPASTTGFNGAPGGMPEGSHNQMMYNKQIEMSMMANGPNGAMMRPPNFNGQMGIDGQPMNPNMVRPPAGRGQHPGGAMWQGQPGAQMPVGQPGAPGPGGQPGQPGGPGGQQQPGGQPNNAPTPQQVGTPQQGRQNIPHGNMAPPQAPGPNTQGGGGNRQPGAPASPQVSNQQPPTPTQGGKVAPGKKAGNAKNAKVWKSPFPSVYQAKISHSARTHSQRREPQQAAQRQTRTQPAPLPPSPPPLPRNLSHLLHPPKTPPQTTTLTHNNNNAPPSPVPPRQTNNPAKLPVPPHLSNRTSNNNSSNSSSKSTPNSNSNNKLQWSPAAGWAVRLIRIWEWDLMRILERAGLVVRRACWIILILIAF